MVSMAHGCALRGLLGSKESVEFTETQRSLGEIAEKSLASIHLGDTQPILLSLARPS